MSRNQRDNHLPLNSFYSSEPINGSEFVFDTVTFRRICTVYVKDTFKEILSCAAFPNGVWCSFLLKTRTHARTHTHTHKHTHTNTHTQTHTPQQVK